MLLLIGRIILSVTFGFLVLLTHREIVQLIMKKYIHREAMIVFVGKESENIYNPEIEKLYQQQTRVFFFGKFLSFFLLMAIISFFYIRIHLPVAILFTISVVLKCGTFYYLADAVNRKMLSHLNQKISLKDNLLIQFFTVFFPVILINFIIFISYCQF